MGLLVKSMLKLYINLGTVTLRTSVGAYRLHRGQDRREPRPGVIALRRARGKEFLFLWTMFTFSVKFLR